MTAETALAAGCVYNAGFAIFHLFFWKIFRWREDLAALRPVNRAIMQVMNLCLAFVFLMFAGVSAFHPREMTGTVLGRTLLALIALFWLTRAVEQAVFFERTRRSAAFVVVFLLGALLYGYVWAAA